MSLGLIIVAVFVGCCVWAAVVMGIEDVKRENRKRRR